MSLVGESGPPPDAMPLPRTLELTIDSVAAGGDGVGRSDGLVVFVPRTAPGDVVRVRAEPRGGGRFARGALVELVHASPSRIEPPCQHYVQDDCGGCQLQHMRYDAQVEAKRAIIRDALLRIARRDVELPEVRTSPIAWRYRRKLTLALRWVRGRWIAGLHPLHDPAHVFDLADCPITQEPVLETWREIMHHARHFPRVPALRGAVRIVDGGASFVLEGASAWPQARRLFEAVPALTALWWQPDGHRRRPIAQRDRAGDHRDSASFVQVNPRVAETLREHVLERVRAYAPARVIDCHAGSGETAARLAGPATEVVAVELDRHAAAAAGARLAPPSRAIAGAVEDVLPELLPADVVLLNPPRTGLDPGVSAALEAVAAAPRGVLYVSCNPATLARDLARMPRYRIASVLGFDMFPQTAHVETVCELVPVAGAGAGVGAGAGAGAA
jgi:23S rRNA (uracil1939-C5)-methyltransferase